MSVGLCTLFYYATVYARSQHSYSKLMMTPICPRLLNIINDFVLLRFRARAPDYLSAIEVIFIIIMITTLKIVIA